MESEIEVGDVNRVLNEMTEYRTRGFNVISDWESARGERRMGVGGLKWRSRLVGASGALKPVPRSLDRLYGNAV